MLKPQIAASSIKRQFYSHRIAFAIAWRASYSLFFVAFCMGQLTVSATEKSDLQAIQSGLDSQQEQIEDIRLVIDEIYRELVNKEIVKSTSQERKFRSSAGIKVDCINGGCAANGLLAFRNEKGQSISLLNSGLGSRGSNIGQTLDLFAQEKEGFHVYGIIILEYVDPQVFGTGIKIVKLFDQGKHDVSLLITHNSYLADNEDNIQYYRAYDLSYFWNKDEWNSIGLRTYLQENFFSVDQGNNNTIDYVSRHFISWLHFFDPLKRYQLKTSPYVDFNDTVSGSSSNNGRLGVELTLKYFW